MASLGCFFCPIRTVGIVGNDIDHLDIRHIGRTGHFVIEEAAVERFAVHHDELLIDGLAELELANADTLENAYLNHQKSIGQTTFSGFQGREV